MNAFNAFAPATLALNASATSMALKSPAPQHGFFGVPKVIE